MRSWRQTARRLSFGLKHIAVTLWIPSVALMSDWRNEICIFEY